jgi:hypothetical protein
LDEICYKHFSILHKYAFNSEYKNVETGEIIKFHTNRIKGALKYAKEYFRIMFKTKATQWEWHLAEVECSSEVKGNRYQEFFDLLKSVYRLEGSLAYK